MSLILYYSNYCEHSKKVIQSVANDELSKDIHFISIDRRAKEADGKIYIVLPNGKKIVMPSNITKVPALLLLKDNYKVLYGDEISSYINQKKQVTTQQVTYNNMEPTAFSFGGGGGGFGIASDQDSFIESSAEELSAKGEGGMKQMHNYVDLSYADKITTPTEDYESGRMGAGDISMEQMQQDRNAEMSNVQYRT